jgi:hypothetical protein
MATEGCGIDLEVLDEASRYVVAGAEHKDDSLAPLRRAIDEIVDLMQALEKLEAESSEVILRDLGRELAEVKGSVQSLGWALMLSQDLTLAVSAHELLAEAEEAI